MLTFNPCLLSSSHSSDEVRLIWVDQLMSTIIQLSKPHIKDHGSGYNSGAGSVKDGDSPKKT